jgi:hypothetical protein
VLTLHIAIARCPLSHTHLRQLLYTRRASHLHVQFHVCHISRPSCTRPHSTSPTSFALAIPLPEPAANLPLLPCRFKAYIFPTGSPCTYTTAEVGCDSDIDCNSWYSPDTANTIYSYVHALGYNMKLYDASTASGDSDDPSSAMGGCCNTRCYNPPNNWQLGWATPLATITSETLAPGQTQNLTLPLSHTAVASIAKIVPSWQTDWPASVYWLGYRGDASGYSGYDVDLPAAYANKVNVYRYDGASYTDSQSSSLLASLDNTTDTWSLEGVLVVRMTGISAGGAEVAIFRCALSDSPQVKGSALPRADMRPNSLQ